MDKKRFIIIDSNAVIHRAYHALPPLTNKKGELINAIYGFLSFFLKTIKDFQPNYIAAAFDSPGPTFRHSEYKEYKATREKVPDELLSQIPKLKEILKSFGVQVFEKKGLEADDIIGIVSAGIPKDIEVIILTGDMDIVQLVKKNIKVYSLKRGVKEGVLYDEEKVKEKYDGLNPLQVVDFKALRGDPSDNIPGVPGIGEKTAIELLKKFGSIENLYNKLEKNSENLEIKESLKEKLLTFKNQAFLSKKLARIKKKDSINFSLENCCWGLDKLDKILEVLKKHGFKSLVSRVSKLVKERYTEEKGDKKENQKEKTKENLRLC